MGTEIKKMENRVSRRQLLIGAGCVGAAAALTGIEEIVRLRKAPAVGRHFTLTVSTWGGVTQDSIKAYVEPEFKRQTGATIAYDIGSQGARMNKLLAQRDDPPADVFFSTDEIVVAGYNADILAPFERRLVPNAAQLADWSHTVPSFAPNDSKGDCEGRLHVRKCPEKQARTSPQGRSRKSAGISEAGTRASSPPPPR